MLLAHRPWPVVMRVLNDPKASGLDTDEVEYAALILETVFQ
ncbi:hypothetical protein [Deinococcus humi]|uniref:Uncharacterized protein n=1 Tax=Deinococcus humi TaxID=662880 RepID=A0A7W8JVA0_9DEIO|nr:hypothetical protein [Deinococcus humi]MBB5363876.1 hypothetical protein [Deinococcus humi]